MLNRANAQLGYRVNNGSLAFTIVELLIVIVVIGVLAAISIVAYSGVANNARVASLQSNLSQMAKAIEIYKVQNSDIYPDSLAGGSIKTPDIGTYNYQSNGRAYCLSATESGISYKITNTAPNPTEGTCSGVLASGDTCPSGFIVVPGNSNLGTSEFCVMKYEAKQASATVPASTASGVPWTSISQTNAITYSANVSGCTGCHLITEAEWMTIAANVLSVPSNWSSGTVGSGYIYNGHVNSNPSNALEASSDDSDGLYGITGGTGNNSSSNNRRTLTLTNDEVIWDFPGNVYEWTSQAQTVTNVGVSGDSGFNWREWTLGSLSLGNLPSVSRPSTLASSPGLSSVTSWDTANGVGSVYANYADSATRAFRRGGYWNGTSTAGVLSLYLLYSPSSTLPPANIGFRVAR